MTGDSPDTGQSSASAGPDGQTSELSRDVRVKQTSLPVPTPTPEPGASAKEGPTTASSRALDPTPPPTPEYEELYRIGDWAGLPNYGCPFCAFTKVGADGPAVVEDHVTKVHPEAMNG
jgi:hypothetical protein